MGITVPLMGPLILKQDLVRQLIQQANAGDLASFERIVLLHERLVLRLAQRLLLNSESAKDAAQEVFLRLHRKLNSFKEEKQLAPWLYRITVNVCHDLQRGARRHVPLDLVPDPPDESPDPEQSALNTQRRQLILTALTDLSPREREAVVLRDLENCSIAEVAQILKSTEGTVRSQLSTGRVKLKNFITARLRKPSC